MDSTNLVELKSEKNPEARPRDVVPGVLEQPQQVALLLLVDHQPEIRAVEIAAQLGLRATAVGTLLNCLEDRLAIRRERLPQNRRARRIVLTERGEALVAASRRQFASSLEDSNDADLRQVRDGLLNLLDRTEPALR